jgi:hypothetical protein
VSLYQSAAVNVRQPEAFVRQTATGRDALLTRVRGVCYPQYCKAPPRTARRSGRRAQHHGISRRGSVAVRVRHRPDNDSDEAKFREPTLYRAHHC